MGINERGVREMKYILLPIHPEWCCKFMNGDKKTEVRRRTALYNAINRLIEEQGKAPCLMYCTKDNHQLVKPKVQDKYMLFTKGAVNYSYEQTLTGKVVAEFEASAEVIYPKEIYGGETFGGLSEVTDIDYETDTLGASELLKRSCLTDEQIADYLTDYDVNLPIFGTAIHVKPGTMKTDGFPKNLSDYGIKRAPQSFMYVEVVE